MISGWELRLPRTHTHTCTRAHSHTVRTNTIHGTHTQLQVCTQVNAPLPGGRSSRALRQKNRTFASTGIQHVALHRLESFLPSFLSPGTSASRLIYSHAVWCKTGHFQLQIKKLHGSNPPHGSQPRRAGGGVYQFSREYFSSRPQRCEHFLPQVEPVNQVQRLY